jgi:hypothetical protein
MAGAGLGRERVVGGQKPCVAGMVDRGQWVSSRRRCWSSLTRIRGERTDRRDGWQITGDAGRVCGTKPLRKKWVSKFVYPLSIITDSKIKMK